MTTFLVALALAAALTPVVIAGLRRWNMLDVPNHRSSHAAPIPRGGGIAVSIATVVAVLVGAGWSTAGAVLVLGALVLAIVGLLDDRRDLPAAPRLAAQLLVPLVGTLLVTDHSGAALVLAVVVAVVATAGYVNAFNFMDGINGISGSQAAVAGVFLAAVGRHLADGTIEAAGWAVAGASIGFLPFNVPRARTFLGDVGSYFLGFWLAATALLVVEAGVSPLVVASPFLLYLADTSVTLIRRGLRGEPLMQAHREHAYQRLTRIGWSHVAVSAVCAFVAAACGAIMFIAIDSAAVFRYSAFVACVVVVAGYVVLPDAILRTRAETRAPS